MLFQFGDIRFELLDGPTGFELDRGVNLAQQERITGKPTLQAPGGLLSTINLSLTLSSWITADVQGSLSRLESMMNQVKEAELINGVGFSYGTFVIQHMRSSIVKTDSKGAVTHAEVSLELLEFAAYDQETTAQLTARKAAFATITANPIQVVPKAIVSTPTALTSRAVILTTVASRQGVADAKKAVSVPDLTTKYLTKAVRGMEAASEAVAEARASANQIQSGVSNIADLKSTLENMQTRTEAFLTGLKSAQVSPGSLPAVVGGAGAAVESYIRTLTSKAAILSTVVSTRQ